MNNPYPEFIVDEVLGAILNEAHKVWQAGYDARSVEAEIELQMLKEEMAGKCRQRIETLLGQIEGYRRSGAGIMPYIRNHYLFISDGEWEAIKKRIEVGDL